jgi:hypothetical protein
MIPPSRTTSERVLLRVSMKCLELQVSTGEDRQRLETPFDAAAFDPRLPSTDTRLNVVEARGELLWTAAFAGSLGLFVERAAVRAREQRTTVTLQIVPAPDLPGALRLLPWEVLFDPQRRDFLSLKSGWSVIRGVRPFQAARPLPTADLRVRVLVLVDSPEAEDESQAVRRLVGDRGTVDIVRVSTVGQLTAELARDASVVHVIASGLGEGLVLPEERYAGCREIAQAIAGNHRIGLAVFSGSQTAQVAEEVAKDAKVTVLAHRTDTRGEHAALLSETFYRHLLDGIPADVALTEARRALDRRFPGERAWTSAVLFTGWPPLRLSWPAAASGADHPADSAAKPDLDAVALRELLHTRNRDRARQLLTGHGWAPVKRQLQQAESHLQGKRPPAAP